MKLWVVNLTVWRDVGCRTIWAWQCGSGGNRITSHATQTSLTGWCSSLRWRCSNIILRSTFSRAVRAHSRASKMVMVWGSGVRLCHIRLALNGATKSTNERLTTTKMKRCDASLSWHWHILVLCSHHPGILERCPIVNQQKVKYTDASHHATITWM